MPTLGYFCFRTKTQLIQGQTQHLFLAKVKWDPVTSALVLWYITSILSFVEMQIKNKLVNNATLIPSQWWCSQI